MKHYKASQNHYYKVVDQSSVLHINTNQFLINIIPFETFDDSFNTAISCHAPMKEITEHIFIIEAYDKVMEAITRLRCR